MALHEEVNDKSVSLAVRVGTLAAGEIRKAMDNALADWKKGRQSKNTPKRTESVKHGKQTLKQLSKQNAGLSSVELKTPDLRLLYGAMKRNSVDFACVKDGKGKYTLFFKGRDADAIKRGFQQYTRKLTTRKASISKVLMAMKELAKTLNDGIEKVKNRSRGAR